ncbi:MAG TPA: hypothetical protein VK709_02475 [Candidatus Saccharimonadales bacterium]|jgi:hypothetical protein|nr:hypothetical protein [Candidatus Saccharimonadales bacterium]
MDLKVSAILRLQHLSECLPILALLMPLAAAIFFMLSFCFSMELTAVKISGGPLQTLHCFVGMGG